MEEMKTAPGAEKTETPPLEAPKLETNRPAFPTVGDVLAMLGIFLVAQLIGAFAGIILGLAPFSEAEQNPEAMSKFFGVGTLIANTLMLFGIIFYRNVRGGRGPLVRFSAKGFNPALILWGFLLIMAVGIVLEPLLNLLPAPPLDKLGTGVWTMAALVLMAPVFEELICRGVVLESLRSRYGVVAAWFFSALFFAVIHFQAQQSVNAFFLGLVFAFLYLRTDSIWIVIILHAMNNAIAYILLVAGVDPTTMLVDLVSSRALYAVIYIGAATLCAVSGLMVWRTLKRLDGEEKNCAKA